MEVKSVGTFPVILVKLVTPPPRPIPRWIFCKMSGNEYFFGLNITGESTWGDDVLMFKFLKELKADHKIAVRSRVLRYYVITWKGFSHSPKFFRPPLSEIDLVLFGKMVSIRCRWSACCAKELGCSAWTFTEFTQTELSDDLNDVFLIEFLKIFNTCSTCFYYLRRRT